MWIATIVTDHAYRIIAEFCQPIDPHEYVAVGQEHPRAVRRKERAWLINGKRKGAGAISSTKDGALASARRLVATTRYELEDSE